MPTNTFVLFRASIRVISCFAQKAVGRKRQTKVNRDTKKLKERNDRGVSSKTIWPQGAGHDGNYHQGEYDGNRASDQVDQGIFGDF